MRAPSELNCHRQQHFFCRSPSFAGAPSGRLSIVLPRRHQLAGVEVQVSVTATARDISSWPSTKAFFQNIEARYWSYGCWADCRVSETLPCEW